MDENADSGDILSQMPVSIAYDDNALTLYEKISRTGLAQLEEFIPQLREGTFFRQPQDHSRANTWRKRGKADGLIDFRMSSRSVYNLVRALTRPYVGAHVEYNGHEIKIWKAAEHDWAKPNIEPGKVIISSSDELVIKCADKSISLLEHEFEQLPRVGEYLI
jgi:methionyl-tRNA formyltransferase